MARFTFPLKNALVFLFMSFRFVPFIAFVIPLYIFYQLGILTRVIVPLSMPGISVTIILGFMFCWNAFNYSLMLAGRQTFLATVGAIQFISYEQVL